MGTNYYLHEPSETRCPTCGHDPENGPLHIGKSSFGWRFALHIIPEQKILTLDDWKARWNKDGVKIFNEYEEEITPEKMLAVITERGPGNYCPKDRELSNHNVDGIHCVESGSNSYDYILGDFS